MCVSIQFSLVPMKTALWLTSSSLVWNVNFIKKILSIFRTTDARSQHECNIPSPGRDHQQDYLLPPSTQRLLKREKIRSKLRHASIGCNLTWQASTEAVPSDLNSKYRIYVSVYYLLAIYNSFCTIIRMIGGLMSCFSIARRPSDKRWCLRKPRRLPLVK
jgi:hypothetical protein